VGSPSVVVSDVRRGDSEQHWGSVVVAGLTIHLLRHVQRH